MIYRLLMEENDKKQPASLKMFLAHKRVLMFKVDDSKSIFYIF